mmetsp:Transcript_98042/g.277626  ORF Transcript_98042/g.277626 Transcript_98042/m.277626 type:complete len:221 (-) Transcript_98042:58-720(-)
MVKIDVRNLAHKGRRWERTRRRRDDVALRPQGRHEGAVLSAERAVGGHSVVVPSENRELCVGVDPSLGPQQGHAAAVLGAQELRGLVDLACARRLSAGVAVPVHLEPQPQACLFVVHLPVDAHYPRLRHLPQRLVRGVGGHGVGQGAVQGLAGHRGDGFSQVGQDRLHLLLLRQRPDGRRPARGVRAQARAVAAQDERYEHPERGRRGHASHPGVGAALW